ncbi:MAG: hypothetical protein M3539_14660, partial [Acidobacteriota bacterium]|nr:hypothetical protein [Acidobacteriota bacterium]
AVLLQEPFRVVAFQSHILTLFNVLRIIQPDACYLLHQPFEFCIKFDFCSKAENLATKYTAVYLRTSLQTLQKCLHATLPDKWIRGIQMVVASDASPVLVSFIISPVRSAIIWKSNGTGIE